MTPEPHDLVSVVRVLDGGFVAACSCGYVTSSYVSAARARFWCAEHHGRVVAPRWTDEDHRDFWRAMIREERAEVEAT